MFPLECIIDNLYYMEKVSPLISVIIPVYKVELYLKQCVESILIQTYSIIEIRLFDDGFPDSCPQICDEYARKDYRIKVIHKSNGGLSDARNVGLNGAVGQYVVFVDSDDYWLNENCLKSLVDEINRTPNIDFICFNSYSFVNGTIKNDWIAYSDNILNAQDNNSLINSLIKSGTVPMAAWSKIIRRSFLLENRIQFIKGTIAEDVPWFLEILRVAKCFRFVNLYIYVYRKGVSTSITNTFSEKSFDDLFSILRNEILRIHKDFYPKEIQDALLSFMAYEFCILLSQLRLFPKQIRNIKRKDLLNYKWLLNYTLNYKVKYCAIICKMFGFRMLEFILGQYLRVKI